MKNLTRITTLFAFTLILSVQLNAQKTLPDLEVMTLSGEKVNISDHAKNGKLTVLSFWATWCSPCKKELDAIAEGYDDWDELFNAELIAISIDNTRSMAKVGPMVAQKGWEYPIYLDPNEELKQLLNVPAVPHTFIVDQSGEIVYSHSGYLPGDEFELEDKLEELSSK